MTTRVPAFCLVCGTVFGAVSTAAAAPQTFDTALPVAASEFVYREQFVYRKATDDPSPADRELHVRGGISVLGYGVTGDFAVFGVLPYLDKELDVTTPAGRATRDTSGFADARLFGRYTVYKDDAPGRTFRIAPFFGVELPTGDDKDSDSLGRLPAPLQLGSGSWDPFGGIVLTYQTLDYQIDAQASYKPNNEANNRSAEGEAAALQMETFAIENMTCALCPLTVRKALAGVAGVKSVIVDINRKTATVGFDPAVTDTIAIGNASTNAGYPATVSH